MNAMGIDIGTTSISMVLLDEDTGLLVARETVNHASFIDDGCPVGKTQDAERIIGIVMDRFTALVSAHGKPCCIGLTGQMHGMLYVDANGDAVSPLYTWQDGRGNLPMTPEGMTYAEYLNVFGASASGYGLTTHFYMVFNRQVPPNAASMVTISDYLAMKLTGSKSPVLGADMAASWGCFDLKKKAFTIEDPLLPRVATGYEIIGETSDGVPVMVSAGDNQASFIGSVRDTGAAVLLNIGTGSQISLGTDRFFNCGGAIELRPCADDYILAGSGLCGGRAYAMLEQFYREASGTDAPCYDRMLEQATAFVAQRGMDAAWRVRTTFSGTRSNPLERGSIQGIGVDNFHPGALTAGLVAGILGELHDCYRDMTALTGRPAAVLAGSGNGLRRNPLMRHLAEDIFGMKLYIPAHMEEAACGAALCALTASGRVKSLRDAQAMIRYLED